MTTVRSVTARQLAELMVGSELPDARDPRVDRHRPGGSRRRRASPSRGDGGRPLVDDVVVHRARRRDRRHRRRRGQRPDRADRGASWASCTARQRQRRCSAARTWPASARASARASGLGYIPEDRQRDGLVLDGAAVGERRARPPDQRTVRKGLWIDRQGARRPDPARSSRSSTSARPVRRRRAARCRAATSRSSIVGREMMAEPEGAASPPTPPAAIDVGAQAAIWDDLREARAAGLAVLLVSADLEELIGLSDTLARDAPRPARGHARPGDGHPGRARLVHDRRPGTSRASGMRRSIVYALAAPVHRRGGRARDLVDRPAPHRRQPDRGLPGDVGVRSTRPTRVVAIINLAVPYYVAGVAVAIGFKMNLFNIGADGQYRLAALLAAAAGAAVTLPAPLHVAVHHPRRHGRRRRLRRHRRRPEGDPRASTRSCRRSCSTSSPLASRLPARRVLPRTTSVKPGRETKPLPRSGRLPVARTGCSSWIGYHLPERHRARRASCPSPSSSASSSTCSSTAPGSASTCGPSGVNPAPRSPRRQPEAR